MALTYGFYNSIEGDRKYDATQVSRIFDGIIKDGVYATYEKALMVIASENAGEVIIQPGRAWFNHTWSYNDANLIMQAPAPEVLLDRIDALVLEVNEELAVRANSFKWVQGTPSSRPENPTLTNTSTVHQYPLCYIHRYPETTMIYTRDITNMIGTSECPFVTGVLEGIDLDAWINQWDNEFHNWENTTKTSFETWMLNQESTYIAWETAMKAQMADDIEDVEEWVETIRNIIDAETATHLQNEIDELRSEITAGSHIIISTSETELFGREVTITTEEGVILTEEFDSNGVADFKSVPYVGNLTVSSSYGTETAERIISTPYYARYTFTLAFWSATVNITADTELGGETVTITDSSQLLVGTVVLNASGIGVFNATYPDTYKFSVTHGGQTMEVSLAVTQETTYNVTIHAGFNWRGWVDTARFLDSTDYNSLDEVLADEKAVRELCLEHACVDYMAEATSTNEELETVINNDLFAKWVNNSDYALDFLGANAVIKALMDEADKYGYGEWVITDNTTTPPTWGAKGNVPVMTANNVPYGVANATSATSGYEAYKAFDNDASTSWASTSSDVTNGRLIYTFSNPICPKRVSIKTKYATQLRLKTFSVLGSNDGGTTWETIREVETLADTTTEDYIRDIECNKYYTTLALGNLTTYTGSTNIVSLQFYGRELSVSVPTMTGNTTPFGEAFASDVYDSSYPAWYAFDTYTGSSDGKYWASAQSDGLKYIGYKFPSKVKAKYIFTFGLMDNSGSNPKLEGSNDGNTWTQIAEIPELKVAGSKTVTYLDDDIADYQYFRISGNRASGYLYMYEFRIYGFDYSEKEFETGTTKKWLYDHGVELESITEQSGGGTIRKRSDDILMIGSSSSTIGCTVTSGNIDFTDYKLAFARCGKEYIYNQYEGLIISASYDSTAIAIQRPLVLPLSYLDISAVNQTAIVYVGTSSPGGKYTLSELWLE